MKTKSIFILLILGISVLVLGACNVLVPVTGGDAAATQVQSTVNAIFTQSAFETLVAGQDILPTQTPAAAEPTATPWIITATPVPATPTPVFTATPLPTATNIPLPTATPVPCDWLSYVSDVTIPDGTSFAPGESFVKTWRIKNIGSCSWVPGYALVFSDGNSMSGASSVALTTTVAPGQSVDVSVTLVAPKDEGDYTGNWKMRSAGGVVFGGGANANKPFWVKINVKSVASNDPKKPYVLVLNYCAAEWRSNAGLLNCPTAEGANGAVYRVNEPVLEGGYKDDEPAIVMIPGSGDGGMVQGKFPAYTVQTGDEFRALIGCMDASKNCNAMVQLNYSADGGAVQNLGTWTQTSDGNFDRINISLASFVGKKVQFYLVVYNNGNSGDDRIFWLMPHVYNPTK